MSWLVDAFRSAGTWVSSQVAAIGEALGDLVNSAQNWLSDNISGLPLRFFSLMAELFPSQSILGVEYFKPTHADGDVNALMSGSKWSGAEITYALPDSRNDYGWFNGWFNPSASGYKALSAETEAAVHDVMASVAHFVNVGIAFTGRGDATIQVAGFQPGSTITRSHGYYPGVPNYGGETWLEYGSSTSVMKGSANYFVVMHELGHALGLKHTHDSAPGLPAMSAQRDSTEYTVMSYNETTNRPQSFMQYDIAALQAMYGADFTTNGGDTVYGWDASTGEMSINGAGQGAVANQLIFLTIWDGGGTDTYDMSNYADNAVIDLAPGGFSRFSLAQLANKGGGLKVNGNVYNAFQYHGDARSLIENAVAGSGADTISGNAARNLLVGNGGSDTLSGLAADDTLDGGGGADTLFGGTGHDVLYGGTDADLLRGDSGSDVLEGGSGHDILDGGDGTDTLIGGQGNDFYWIDSTGDVVTEGSTGEGIDTVGTFVSYTLAAGSGIEHMGAYEDANINKNISLTGNELSNTLTGNTGDNQLNGRGGADVLAGGKGDDFYWVDDIGDRVVEGADGGTDTVGTTVSYSLAGRAVERMGAYGAASIDLTGNELANTLTGNGGANLLRGQDGNDVLYGMAGHDTLEGGAGNDLLVGGQGSDVFAFRAALHPVSNVDRIADFSVGEDRIVLDRRIFTAFGTAGALGEAAFAIGTGATTAEQRIVYNRQTGELLYDADGAGAAAGQVKFATLAAGLGLSHHAFTVV